MHRKRLGSVVSTWAMAVAAFLGACHGADDDEQAELQALLRDADLQQIPPGATQAAPGAGAVTRTAESALDAAPPPPVTLSWRFDDCSPSQTELREARSFFVTTAFRAVNAACTPGVQGQGVAIAATEDIVYVPDEPSFRFEGGVTVGGWFKATSTSGTKTLIRKRDRGTSSFALVLNGGKFQFVASFGDGGAASVTAPTKAKVGVFQQVAATYDGSVLRLFVDGAEVSHVNVSGTIPVGAGPLLIGNDGSERRFAGTVDNITFSNRALDANAVQQLNCLFQRPELVLTPETIPPTPVGVPVTFDVGLVNHNPANCAPLTFQLTVFDGGLKTDPVSQIPISSPPVPSGQTGHMTITASAPLSAEPFVQRSLTLVYSEPV